MFNIINIGESQMSVRREVEDSVDDVIAPPPSAKRAKGAEPCDSENINLLLSKYKSAKIRRRKKRAAEIDALISESGAKRPKPPVSTAESPDSAIASTSSTSEGKTSFVEGILIW